MVTSPGATPGANALHPLNNPSPVQVREDDRGQPQAVRLRGAWLEVEAIEDTWLLEDEWWRDEPIERRYYTVQVDEGLQLTTFRDLRKGTWYAQKP